MEMIQFINHFLFGTIVLLAAVQFWLCTSLYKVNLPKVIVMDYSRSALQTSTPAPVAYDGQQFRLPSIPETRELALHPGDGRAPPPAYGQQAYEMQLQTMPTHEQAVMNPNVPQNVVYQVQQPVQVTPTPCSNVAAPLDFVHHSSIPNEVIWFNMSVAKVSVNLF